MSITTVEELFSSQEARLQKKYDWCIVTKRARQIMDNVLDSNTLAGLKVAVEMSRKGDMAVRILITLDETGRAYLTTEVLDHSLDESQLPAYLRSKA